VLWYEDGDGDGYGSDVTMSTCPEPMTGKWARVGGD
jgi:hypothetical protein